MFNVTTLPFNVYFLMNYKDISSFTNDIQLIYIQKTICMYFINIYHKQYKTVDVHTLLTFPVYRIISFRSKRIPKTPIIIFA